VVGLIQLSDLAIVGGIKRLIFPYFANTNMLHSSNRILNFEIICIVTFKLNFVMQKSNQGIVYCSYKILHF